MKKLPISIQTFEKIREGDMIYVDKTKYVHKLISEGTYYFLARPRRFGKSLLLTTLRSYFEGKKELFEELYIAEKEKEWKEYPVIHLDFSAVSSLQGPDIFHHVLMTHIKSLASEKGINIVEEEIGTAFLELIKKTHEKYGKVVLLVDEYDRGLVNTLTNEAHFNQNSQVLRDLYTVLKYADSYLRFVMLTGVSRFAKVGVFSGLNNLKDISMDRRFANAVGFTKQELHAHFTPYLERMREEYKMTESVFLQHYKEQYNGYSWDAKNYVYNPFSVLNSLIDLEFQNYWFSSGTPTFLIDLIKIQKTLPEKLEGFVTSDLLGSSSSVRAFPLIPLLFQTGYLTIEEVIQTGIKKQYRLNYPNEEVRESFIVHIAASFMKTPSYAILPETVKLQHALREERIDDFLKILQSFFADIPARLHIPREAYYHSLVYMILRLSGIKAFLEKETDKGRIDAVFEFENLVYILEFKFAQNKRIKNIKTLTKKAIAQIEEQKYYEPYMKSGKKVVLFGIGFLNKKLDGKVKVI